jgi:hypothetical protein
MAVVDASYDGGFKTLLSALKGFLFSVVRTVVAILILNKNKFAKEILLATHYFGRVFGLLGFRTSRYVATSKQGE